MRMCCYILSLLIIVTVGFTPDSEAATFEVGQTITLKAKKPNGVPLHHESPPSYWKHVPNDEKGTIREIATTGWLSIALESGEQAWVHPKYVEASLPSFPTGETQPNIEPTVTPEVSPQPKPLFHESSSQEEVLVWQSAQACEKVVNDGGRMALTSTDNLRIGTWNIRWFPYGQSPDRSRTSEEGTDIPWLICTMAWMNMDLLAVEESLATPTAKQAWKTVVESLGDTTGDSWRWTPQRCGEPDSHKIGFLWNTKRVDLSLMKSLGAFNVKAQSDSQPCEGGLRPGHYAYVQSVHQPGADFHVIALHLKSGPTVFALEDRQKALNRLDKTVKPFLKKDKDVVILGDFNTMGAGDNASRKAELKYVRRMVSKEMPGFQDIQLTPQCSHYFRGRPGWLDHVLVNHGMEEVHSRSARVTGYCAVAECERIQGDYPSAYERLSDHCPVVIEIQNQDKD